MSDSKVAGGYVGARVVPRDDVWDVLERFASDLHRCDKGLRHKLVLAAIHDCINAEMVFWYPGRSSESLEFAGECVLPTNWCAGFARKLIDGTPGLDGRLLRSNLPENPSFGPYHPCSAALVRVSRSQGSWLVAVNFTKKHFLQDADLRIMALVRRIFVNHRRASDMTTRMTDTLAWLVQCLTTSIDSYLPQSRGHSERVAKIAVAIGKRMRLQRPLLNDLYFAGLLHDIGITSVPQSVLLKPEKLTADEFAAVKTHPIIGDGILAGIKQLAHLRPAVRHHHERYDGLGYPDGLAGDDIPLAARILAVADAFDAMRSPRPHRPAIAKAEVDAILAAGAGTQWDPKVIEYYLQCCSHFHAFYDKTASQTESAVVHVVESWNSDSTDEMEIGGNDRRGPTNTIVDAETQ
jgi:HD-GYP domain-containing protein (c-di-GMP phosphodiesterase class II)